MSESAIISFITSRIGTDSWHLFSKKSSSRLCRYIFLFITKFPTKKPQNWWDFRMKCIFLATLLLFFNDMKRDRPGWINVIVWIDSFFELQCYGAMLWFSRVRDSWWNKISFSTVGFFFAANFIQILYTLLKKW
jgi:hypothetical protein